MLVLILGFLLLFVCGSEADPGSSPEKKKCYQSNFCITLREGNITAEVGLCVVIPCSFTTDSTFRTTNITWSKCETPNKNCGDLDMIYNSWDPSKVLKSGFEGRVYLLGLGLDDRSPGNCRIIINDLRKSDSGFYQLRVEGTKSARRTEFVFPKKASLSVKDLTQKPTVTVPPLTEGQQTTLSCTAPGLCSGSAPQITWTLRGRRDIKGKNKKENPSSFEQRHSSTLTFTPSAEHHGTKTSCKVRFTNRVSTEKTKTLRVTYLKDPVITGNRSVELGDALNLTCSVDSFPPSVVTWTKHSSKQTIQTDTSTAKLFIRHMTAEDVGKYICTASHPTIKRTACSEVYVTTNVSPTCGPPSVLPWAVAAVSLIVNAVLIICLVFLWTKRKKVNSNQEDRTYMSVRKTDRSPEYDVIYQSVN